jgi:D-sedoheptulose 7-phosphate isomerase
MDHVLQALVEHHPDLSECIPSIALAFDTLAAGFAGGGKLLVCGNGGSAADSEHIVGELMKGFASRRPVPAETRRRLVDRCGDAGNYLADHLQGALAAIALVSHSALQTAFANDVAADMGFAQQVYGYGRAGDCLLAISTSGNAVNVVHALQVAHVLGLRTVGLTGPGGGAMAELCDVTICAPGARTPEIQEHHLPIYHALCEMLEEAFFKP